jgi:RNA polymerase sigma-70 factor (ECF subfamily)
VELARDGDHVAFAELYVHYFDHVYRYLVVALKNDEDAQEIAQDVFTRVLGSLDRYDESRGAFRDWLFAVVRNRALDHLRRASRQEAIAPERIRSYMPSVTALAIGVSERLDPRVDVQAIVEALPAAQRRAIVLRFVFDMNAAEIAAILGTTADAVRHSQHRGLKAIAARLEPADAA